MTLLTLPRAATPSVAALDLPRVQRNNPRRLLRSVRFNRADSAGFTRTPGSATNRKTYTFSTWIKLGRLGSQFATGRSLLGANGGASDTLLAQLTIDTSHRITFSGNSTNWKWTTARLIDHAAWYHIVMAVDTNQGTANDRIKIYINGSLQTAFDINNAIGAGADTGINNTAPHNLFDQLSGGGGAQWFDGCVGETIFVDGRQCEVTEFGYYDNDGVWQPRRYGGGIGGANGFILDFENGASTAALGTPREGTAVWTANNLSVAAGVIVNDYLQDGPSNNFAQFSATDTNAGGSLVRQGGMEFANGSGSTDVCRASIALPRTGRWYWESPIGTMTGGSVGVKRAACAGRSAASGALGNIAAECGYSSGGNRLVDGVSTAYLATYTSGDVIGVLYDADKGTINFHKNGVWGGEIAYAWSEGLAPAASCSSGAMQLNFGQQPFAYPLWQVTGAKRLCTDDLPAPTVAIGRKYFDVVLYTGDASASQRSIQGFQFKPDLAIFKNRTVAANPVLLDPSRGYGQSMFPNSTAGNTAEGELISLDERGVTVLRNGGIDRLNTAAGSFMTMGWRKGPHFDFRFVSHTNGVATVVGFEGLGGNIEMAMVKRTDAARAWSMYWSGLTAGNLVNWESTAAEAADTSFTVSGRQVTISSALPTGNYLVIVYTSIPGLCRVGLYTGNGAADGPMVWCGFLPRWIMTKRRAGAIANYQYLDRVRDPVNTGAMRRLLMNDAATVESAARVVDFVSNGFKVRDTDSDWNASADYVFLAMAETPFKLSRAA